MVKSSLILYVEGGGKANRMLANECRRAFHTLLERAGLGGRMPRIVACGGRAEAYKAFCTAIEGPLDENGVVLLLVDAEDKVIEQSPWEHVKKRPGDGWCKPAAATDKHLHLMVQCMESWFLADRLAMRKFFGQGFEEKALPPATANLEAVRKDDLYKKLAAATKQTKTKGTYGKGSHSFSLLATLNPRLVRMSSQWAERFFAALEQGVP
jgi:hypothetical protein